MHLFDQDAIDAWAAELRENNYRIGKEFPFRSEPILPTRIVSLCGAFVSTEHCSSLNDPTSTRGNLCPACSLLTHTRQGSKSYLIGLCTPPGNKEVLLACEDFETGAVEEVRYPIFSKLYKNPLQAIHQVTFGCATASAFAVFVGVALLCYCSFWSFQELKNKVIAKEKPT